MRKQLLIGGALILAAIVVGGLLFLLGPSPEQSDRAPNIPLVRAEPIDFASGRLPVLGGGTVRAVERVQLAPQVAGRIGYVSPNLVEGRTVRKGELLVRIDGSDYRNAVEQARADVAQQSVSVAQAREEVRIAEREVARFRQRNQRLASRVPAGVDANDYAAAILPPAALAPGEDFSVTEAPVPNELASRRPQLRAAQAVLARAQAQLADAQLRLSRTAIRAPFDAIVASENVGPGSFANPGQIVAELVAMNSYEVVVPLSPKEAALLSGLFRGQRYPAEVRYDYGGRLFRWEAYVDRADGLLNDETRTVDVYLRVPNPQRGGALLAEPSDAQRGGTDVTAPPLLVGSFVNVAISGEPRDAYAIIPLNALRSGDRIWIVEKGRVHILSVDVIQRDDRFAYVEADGIPRQARIVTAGIEIATDGMRVRIAPAKAGKAKASTDDRSAP